MLEGWRMQVRSPRTMCQAWFEVVGMVAIFRMTLIEVKLGAHLAPVSEFGSEKHRDGDRIDGT